MQRYRDIIPDWERFQQAIRRRMPDTLRANPLRLDADALEARLRAQGWELRRRAWHPWFFEVVRGPAPGHALEHWLGHYYIQEEVSLFAPLALAPRPAERVLDLCAAPGGKTTHLAELMENRGLLVANEPELSRRKALAPNLQRMGVVNALVTRCNGLRFPGGAPFDRVLVDAPCSGEGNVRRNYRLMEGASPEAIRRQPALQIGLLRRAVELTRPGGVIVYSTCTFAPEENEAVVAAVLRSHPVELEWIDVPVPHERGLTAWQGDDWGDVLRACLRLYPHHLDSGGAFVARLRKRSG